MADAPHEDGTEDAPAGRSVPPADGGSSGGAVYALVGVGLEFAVTIGVVAAIGWYLDRRLNTFPWLLIAGAAVGFAAGLTMMIRAGRRAFRD